FVDINAATNAPYIWPISPANARVVRVFSGGDLTLQPNAILNVHPYNSNGISNYGTITNDNATINISPAGGSNNAGILNEGGSFLMTFGGQIQIDGMDRHGIWNTAMGQFSSQFGGTLKIGTSSVIGADGIKNDSGCSFSNNGTLEIKNTGNMGINTNGSFLNSTNGLIKINQIGVDGILCAGATFTNSGEIRVGESGYIGFTGVRTSSPATFKNNASGVLSIWQSVNYGVYVQSNSNFENFGNITLGGLGGAGTQGAAALVVLGVFKNKPGGAIFIDQTTLVGILNGSVGYMPDFNNEGTITIGSIATIGGDGIQNQGIFNNAATGTINIVQSGTHGIFNVDGNFANNGLIKIGEGGSISGNAIWNSSSGTSVFENTSCSAAIHVFAKNIINEGLSFTNNGTILKESTGASNIETNNGVILFNAGSFTADFGSAPISVSGSFAGKKIWTGCDGIGWEYPVNWYPYSTPTTTDEVVIYPLGVDPHINIAAESKSVRVRDGGRLVNDASLAVTDGDLEVFVGATVEGNGQYDLSGNFIVIGGTFIPGNSTVTMTGSVDERAIGFDPISFYNLVIDKPTDKSVRIFGNVSVSNELLINSGDLEVFGVFSGSLTCPFLHLPAGTDVFNYGGNIVQSESFNSFWIQSGATVQGDGFYYINGDFIVDGGTFTPGTSVVTLNGFVDQGVYPDPVNFYTLVIDKPDGTVNLGGATFTLSNELYLFSGNLNLNGSELELTGNGTIIGENAASYIYSTNGGIVKKTLDLNAPTAVNPGNIGISITSTANLGSTTIERGHDTQIGSGGSSILRYFEVTPANNAALNATLVFNYMDHELNGQVEDDLQLFKSEDAGANWSPVSSTLDNTNNTLTATGQATMSRWTASAECMGSIGGTSAVCQDITVDLDATGNYTLMADEVDGGSIGACGIASKSLDMSLLDCGMTNEPAMVTLTIQGGDGGTSSCQASVTVRDVTAPVMVCANPSISVGADGTVNLQTTDLDGGSADNCGMSLSMANVSANCGNV
ncbi:MAG: hypothetical protein KDC44_24080, partial [Phaeodactylibacter sp.]|nr:hypothetical protein [Phaeodactylibacter sp.]